MARNHNTTDLGGTKDAERELGKDAKKKEQNHLPTGWITKFRKRRGNEWLEEIDRDFLRDYTNFTGLDEEVSYLSHGLHIIMSDGLYLDSNGNSKIRTKTEGKHLEAAEMLYSLIHARFLLTNKGLEKLLKKFKDGFYGSCPRYYCEKTTVLPIGMYDKYGKGNVKTYCPSCEDVYHNDIPGKELADGACFGTSLPQVFFMAYPALHPASTLGHYVPKLYGFKIHGSAQHQNSDSVESRHKGQARHRSKPSEKDKIKDKCKENDRLQDNSKDKLPDINGQCKRENEKDSHSEKPRRTRRRRKKTTELKVQ